MNRQVLLTLTVLVLAVGCTSPGPDDTPWTGAACTLAHDSASTYGYTCDNDVTVTIDRTGASSSKNFDQSEKSARQTGMLVTGLDDVGDKAMLIADPPGKLMPATTLHGEAVSRNAILVAKMTLPAPITSEADMTAHATEMATLLNETLKNLQTT
ncbi:hypothetical protein GCM10010112_82330 [Actinoplanes lobatus]|uniref:Lipoprotein n=1 Tax=Actinoplanes lobatus TaxID=113568 RepID=A0A7W7HLA5_9ACTN|nr:hypothetical protein [Actinoplanes lobatus]MBB4752646.1 hypothetical protein [Actinoplanes lobatus]GGN93734.1 hypothetical protein GCM10010112_82330 [Actinoplanes lobatus]GIE44688.1 hypothetical protein Alo02nite_75860 [Actinoplanes lobatus]